MNALILRGKYRGQTAQVSQWCNDWFMLEHKDNHIRQEIFRPAQLAFTEEGMDEIEAHNNNGMLFEWYEVCEVKGDGIHIRSFKNRAEIALKHA